MRAVGVEEEFLLVDAAQRGTAPAATKVLEIARARGMADRDDGEGALTLELQEQQVEVYTAPHVSMPSLGAELRSWRDTAASIAAEVGVRLVASGTAPVVVRPLRVHQPRYDRMAERFGLVTKEQLTCGCHVHVSVTSPDEAVGVLDRTRVWLPSLLALSANSPFWQGHDTGYASFRSQALGRWPVSGPTELFGSAAHYRELVDRLIASEVILDRKMLYFDARCSYRYPTVEIRVPDVCLDVDDTVVIAALCRALVETCAQEWATGEPAPPVPASLLRLATWQAARWGIGDDLLDPVTSRPRPAAEVIGGLLDHVDAALRRSGDRALVTEGVDRLFLKGNGAIRQRDVFSTSGRLSDVLATLVHATTSHEGR